MAVLGKPSQDFVPIKDIRNGVLVLNNGDLRMILMTSSLNFGLKSSEEQAAIILQFQNVLNSIEFPIQIFIQSKRLDIRPYIKMLEEREKVQLIDAMKIQTHEYIGFIRDFTGRTNIMSKTFFIVIPYSGVKRIGKVGGGGFLGGILSGKKGEQKKQTVEEKQDFEEARVQLEQRASIVEQGLARCDIRTTRIGTEEITELFYQKFNPGELDSAVTTANP
jgi:type IV secretory pathway VirB4 component